MPIEYQIIKLLINLIYDITMSSVAFLIPENEFSTQFERPQTWYISSHEIISSIRDPASRDRYCFLLNVYFYLLTSEREATVNNP